MWDNLNIISVALFRISFLLSPNHCPFAPKIKFCENEVNSISLGVFECYKTGEWGLFLKSLTMKQLS